MKQQQSKTNKTNETHRLCGVILEIDAPPPKKKKNKTNKQTNKQTKTNKKKTKQKTKTKTKKRPQKSKETKPTMTFIRLFFNCGFLFMMTEALI